MPNRIIKESICTSENVDKLSAFQETVFVRLIVTCDDYGRMDARPKLLASKLFPLKDIRAAQIEDALRALTSAELVTLYEVDGKPFLQMNTWDRHQQVRAKKSKYPAPESGNITSASICKQMISNASKCPRNPIQSESNPNPNPNPTCAHAQEAFERFWAAYPRHTGKQAAVKAFAKLNPDDELMRTILESLSAWSNSDQWTKDGGQFIPHPATWLNGKRWEDELPAQGKTQKPAKAVSAQQYTQRDYTEDELASYSVDLLKEAREGA